MKRSGERFNDNTELKVVKVITNGNGGRIEAVLYREVDSINGTTGYVLKTLFTCKKMYGKDPEALLKKLL